MANWLDQINGIGQPVRHKFVPDDTELVKLRFDQEVAEYIPTLMLERYEDAESAFGLKGTFHRFMGFICPACEYLYEEPIEPLEYIVCGCGLKMQRIKVDDKDAIACWK